MDYNKEELNNLKKSEYQDVKANISFKTHKSIIKKLYAIGEVEEGYLDTIIENLINNELYNGKIRDNGLDYVNSVNYLKTEWFNFQTTQLIRTKLSIIWISLNLTAGNVINELIFKKHAELKRLGKI